MRKQNGGGDNRQAASSKPGCAAGRKAGRATGRNRTTRPPPRGGHGPATRSTSSGAHSFGITQQFTAQNPANTKLIRQLLCTRKSASSRFALQAISDPTKLARYLCLFG